MILRLYPEQLKTHLNEELRTVYLLLGNDLLLLQESQDSICQIAVTLNFDEHYTYQIDNNTEWKLIFSLCQTISLFSSRQILILILPENGPNAAINEQLDKLVRLLHNDLLLIIRGNKLTKVQERMNWFTHLNEKAVLVICQTPDQEQLSKWVISRAQLHNLQLDKSACQLLCYCYEGNLLALEQTLGYLKFLWPNSNLTVSHIEQVVNNDACFTPFQWINAIRAAQSERALHILYQFRLEGRDPIVLLRTLQRELMLLITLKRQLTTIPSHTKSDKFHTCKNHQTIFTESANQFSHDQLRQAAHILAQTEIMLKQNCSQSVWIKLENLSLLLCHKVLANVFFDG